MERTVKFKKISMFRRLASILFDAILTLCVLFCIDSFIVEPIFSHATEYGTKYQEYMRVCEESHLYVYYSENDSVSLISSKYDERLTEFYNDNDLGYTIADYIEFKRINSDIYEDASGNKLAKPVFIYNAENDTYIETSSYVTELNQTYSKQVKILAEEFQNIDEVRRLATSLGGYTTMFMIISIIISSILVYMVPPLCFKDGETLGKKIMQMKVIDAKTGNSPTKLQSFIRFTFFELTGLALGILSSGITILIAIAFMFFNKNKCTLHDLVAKTIVVCNDYSSNDMNDSNTITITYDDGIESEGEINE